MKSFILLQALGKLISKYPPTFAMMMIKLLILNIDKDVVLTPIIGKTLRNLPDSLPHRATFNAPAAQ